MNKLRKILLGCYGLAFLLTSPAAAQTAFSCAEARVNTVQRKAIATPGHVKRMNQYDVGFYKLDLQLERNSRSVAGSVTTIAKLTNSQLDTFAFELHPNFEILSVVVNGEPQQSVSNDQQGNISVKLSTPIVAPAELTAVITYSGTAPSGANAAIGNGFNTATEPVWGNQVTWSLSEPYAAYEWWPTKQVLTDKADSVHVFVTTSADNKAGSNGLLTNTVPLSDNKVRYEWKSKYPIAYYLISVAVSNYEEYLIYANPAGVPAPIPVLNYIYRGGALNTYRAEIDLTTPLIEFFSELYILYPFAREKYGHSMAPIGGGMEHQTMTTQSTFTFTLTAHELAHQWFGDHVTCASWEDIWLNEGFASYSEYLALERLQNKQAATAWMRDAQAYAKQTPTGSVRVPDTTNVSRIFDYRLTYKKAAAVVHMLRFEINDDALFFQALRTYLQEFGGKTATTADLQRVVEQTTGRNFSYFFEQWYTGESYPGFTVEWNQQGNQLRLLTTQFSTANNFFKTDLEYLIRTADGNATTVRLTHDQPIEDYLLEVEGTVTSITLDPNLWVLHRLERITRSPNLEVEQPLPVLLFPNPAHAAITLANMAFTPTQGAVYDATGRLVKQFSINQAQNREVSIDIRELPAGYYILQVNNQTQQQRIPFAKAARF
ncbi:M1 family aminopeptidase [Pontibacter sp. SGAir0037]|uniref:M1 family aminopeptidase n=1 Tax=Pontibacter sp. SGAir0037 TaxID=2571030 RepID=UPI0010CD4067|nr:M1 family aminopeptidase [Pontibacter sp. SGAir0037]QCR23648.1 hypothetical protein C1N53_15720 [Pontibacter sp. SGAir0037]